MLLTVQQSMDNTDIIQKVCEGKAGVGLRPGKAQKEK